MNNDAKKQLLAQLRAAAKEHLENLNDERERAVAKMQLLGARNDIEAIQLLLEYLVQTENDLLRPLAASRLSEIGGRAVLRDLFNVLETMPNDNVVILIMQIMAEIGDSKASSYLIMRLSDDNNEVRQRAAFALGKTGGKAVFEALMSALENESDLKVRQQIIGALGWLGNENCIPDLVQIMQTDTDKETQTFAAEALGRIGSDKCYEPLVDTLQNQSYKPIVRYYAAHALGLLGDKRAIAVLQAIKDDVSEHSWVAQMASESLEKLQN